MKTEHLDVVIIGAGLSGIGMAYHLQTHCPDTSFTLLEGRETLGGTWDLFRYPGIRSDSSMVTLGYSFRPWTGRKSIAGGAEILKYLQDTARETGVDSRIRFQHRVVAASWSTPDAQWTLDLERGPERTPSRITCNMLSTCAGYYRYDKGFTPDFGDADKFKGRIVHPQMWTQDIDVTGKRVVIIGSGATAVTLVPALAETAAHVTMLQRSPSYVVAWPDEDPFANQLRDKLPLQKAASIARWKGALQGLYLYRSCKTNPARIRTQILAGARQILGPNYDIETHFSPRYDPWDQRLCLAPNGDIFKAINSGRAEVVTATIERLTETGIQLSNGDVLAAEIIVTATGLNLQALGGISYTVDGRRIDPGKLVVYKGVMYEGVPNLVNIMGYVNASWTLKSDLTSRYLCRLIKHMNRTGQRIAVPRHKGPPLELKPWSAFSSGYFARALDQTPKQGHIAPWRAPQSYVTDTLTLRFGRLDDGFLEFAMPDVTAIETSVPSREAAE